MISVVKSFAISGVDAYLVEVETKTIHGQPIISIVGLGDTAVKEFKERLEAALCQGAYRFPINHWCHAPFKEVIARIVIN